MSYIATVYTHRDDGAPTIYALNNGGTTTFSSTSSSGQTATFDGTTTFAAAIPSGYQFKQWVYRIVNLSSTAQHNTSQIFEYTLGYDIFIWAEIEADDSGGGGGGDDSGDTGEWTLTTGAAMTDISTMQTREVVLEPMELYRIAIKPKYSGTLTAMTVGSDTYGYLTTTTSWSAATGKPTNILVENQDNLTGERVDFDFLLTYEVEAGKTYYLWVSLDGFDENDDPEDFTVVVIPPGAQAGTEGGKVYVYDATQGWVECTPLVYADGKWNECSVFIASDST